VAKSGSAPQFEVKEAPTSQFLVHFVEWSDEALSGSTMLSSYDVLPADNSANLLKVGAYVVTDARYFNPYGSASVVASTGFGGDTNTVFTEVIRNAGPDENMYYPGSTLGSFNVFAVGSSPFAAADTLFVEEDEYFMMGLQAGLSSAASIYTEWESQMSDYNDEAADYNDDVAAYNKALEDGEDELPEVPERPCPPGDIESIENVQPYIATATPFTIADYEDDVFAAEYVQHSDTAEDAVVDSWAYGFLRSAAAADETDYAQEYDTDMSVGKVFGRFGQGAMNMPGNNTPFRYADYAEADSLVQTLMVSIFPSVGSSWNGSAAITTDPIAIEVSGAALSWDEYLVVPSASGSADDLDDMDFAKVLGASAMVMAASVAALY